MNAPSRFAEPVSAFIASGVEQRISLPLCISPTRLQRSASSRYAVVMKMVMPSFSSWYRMAQKSRRETGSTPLVGSSRNRIRGRCSSVHISASFCFMPPESCPAGRVAERLHAGHAQQLRGQVRARLPGDAEQVRVEDHVLFHGQVLVQPEALRHVADLVLHRLRFARHVVARHARAALARVHQAAQHAQRGRLARAVRTHQPEDLALRHRQVEMVHRRQFAEALGQAAGFDDGLSITGSSTISASAGMFDFSSRPGFSTSILMRYTSFTRSCCVWICFGVNSACEEMNVTRPL